MLIEREKHEDFNRWLETILKLLTILTFGGGLGIAIYARKLFSNPGFYIYAMALLAVVLSLLFVYRRIKTNRLSKRNAVALMIGTGIIIGAFAWYNSVPALQSRDIVILVAKINNADSSLGLNEQLIQQLKSEIVPYRDVKIKAISQTVNASTEDDSLALIAKENDASLIIWGSFHKSSEKALIDLHTKLFIPTDSIKLHSESIGVLAPVATLNSFAFQEEVGKKMGRILITTVGLINYIKEEYLKSIDCFSRVLNVGNNNDSSIDFRSVKLLRGNSYLFTNQFSSATNDYSSVLASDSNCYEAYLNRGICHVAMSQLNIALNDFAKAESLRDDDHTLYIARGYACMDADSFGLALLDFSKLISLDNNNSLGYVLRAQAFGSLSNFQAALNDLDRAQQLTPDYPEIYRIRGVTHRLMNRRDLTIRDFTKAIDLEPTNDFYYVVRGQTYNMMDNYDAAMNDFNTALRINSDSKDAFQGLYSAYTLSNKTEMLLPLLNDYIDRAPSDPERYYLRASYFRYYQKYYEAIEDITRCIELAPQRDSFFVFRGIVLIREGVRGLLQTAEAKSQGSLYPMKIQNAFESALSDCNRAISINALNYEAYYGRGSALMILHRTLEGKADLQYYLKFGTDPEHLAHTREMLKEQVQERKG